MGTVLERGGWNMELQRESVHMRRQRSRSSLQVTLEDDFNVPDTKPDVERIVTQNGRIEILESNLLNGKLLVKGMLHFTMLYITHESKQYVHSIQGKIPFDEMVNMEEVKEQDEVKVVWNLEDITINLINSRKISVKSLVGLVCSAWEQFDEDLVVGAEADTRQPCRYQEMEVTELKVAKKDLLRAKESFHLPTGKPNIDQILYYNLELQGREMRAQDGQILLRGELVLFVLYSTQEEGKLACYEGEQPFYSTIPCEACKESMLLQMEIEPASTELQIKQDEDGEERLFDAELVLNLDICIFEEKRMQYLQDMYSLDRQLQLEKRRVQYRQLFLQNNSQKRINEQVVVEPPQNPVSQICHSHGTVQMDEIRWEKNQIHMDGSVEITILYLGEQEEWPLGELRVSVPFSHDIEGVGEQQAKHADLRPRLEQLSVTMLGKDTVEVKLLLAMDVLLFENREYDMINGVTEQELDKAVIENLPDLVGYCIQPGDNLWTLAKRFYTTEEAIMELNQLTDPELVPGEKILLLLDV